MVLLSRSPQEGQLLQNPQGIFEACQEFANEKCGSDCVIALKRLNISQAPEAQRFLQRNFSHCYETSIPKEKEADLVRLTKELLKINWVRYQCVI